MAEMRDDRLLNAFDDCLSRLAAGGSVEDCLGRHPDLALELRPIVEAAHGAVAASRVPRPAEMRSRARFLAAAAQKRPARARPAAGLVRRLLTTAFTLFVGAALGLVGLYYASADTVPGDGLYSLKLTVEDIRLQLADDPASRFALEEEFAGRRTIEAQALLARGQPGVVEFSDTLVSREGDRWQVGGFTLRVTGATVIVGDPPPGYFVTVTAALTEAGPEAVRIVSREDEVSGTLSGAGERWAVDGHAFTLIPQSRVMGTLEPGATARVRLRRLQSGGVVAMSVTVLAPPGIPSNTLTLTPPQAPTLSGPTPTPGMPAATAPAQTAEPTRAPAPTDDDDGDNDNDNSGPGGGGDDDDNSGPGGGGGDDGGNSGPGGGDDDDNSGSGGGGNSGPGGGGDDDDDDNSGPGGGGD